VTLLTLGSVFTTFIGERITDLKLGNGTSLLIFTSIISYLPASFGRTVAQAFKDGNYLGLLTIILSFFSLVLGIVYVQVSDFFIIRYIGRLCSGVLSNSDHLDHFRKLSGKYNSTMRHDTAVEPEGFSDLHIYHLRFDTLYSFAQIVNFDIFACGI
jgi:hypothetical protein